jgi:hypothetical protein
MASNLNISFLSSIDFANLSSAAAADNPKPPRQGVTEEEGRGDLASGATRPSTAQETPRVAPTIVAVPKVLVIPKALPLKKSTW